MSELTAVPSKRPHPEDDTLNASLYDVAKEVDRIMLRQTIEDHAAILGLIQVTAQRRMHEHQTRQQKKTDEARQEMERRQRQQQFGIQ